MVLRVALCNIVTRSYKEKAQSYTEGNFIIFWFLKEAENGIFEINAGKITEIANLKDNFEKSLAKHKEIITILIQKYTNAKPSLVTVQKTLDEIGNDYAKRK